VDGVTLMQAHFTRHTFERHSHDTYSIGCTRSGVQTFHCGGTLHASLPGDLVLFNPDEAHDGQPGTGQGFGYSIFYVPESVMANCADRDAGLRMPRYFTQPVVRDAALGALYEQAAQAMAQPRESLRADALMRELLLRVLQRHGEAGARNLRTAPAGAQRLRRVREFVEANYSQDLTVQALAQAAGLSRAHLSRAFAQEFGVPPHVYLNTVRVRQAQAAMLRGEPLAEVAAACGFADQSHFTRRFKGAVGVAPAEWLRQLRA
jgi:AraC-like DNA-binding protein